MRSPKLSDHASFLDHARPRFVIQPVYTSVLMDENRIDALSREERVQYLDDVVFKEALDHLTDVDQELGGRRGHVSSAPTLEWEDISNAPRIILKQGEVRRPPQQIRFPGAGKVIKYTPLVDCLLKPFILLMSDDVRIPFACPQPLEVTKGSVQSTPCCLVISRVRCF